MKASDSTCKMTAATHPGPSRLHAAECDFVEMPASGSDFMLLLVTPRAHRDDGSCSCSAVSLNQTRAIAGRHHGVRVLIAIDAGGSRPVAVGGKIRPLRSELLVGQGLSRRAALA